MVPRLLYRQDSQSQDASDVMEKDEEAIRCAVCGLRITSQKESVSVSGSTEPVFTNPFGYVFKINSFKQAPGCGGAGEYTLENTWFPGFRWRYALCLSCRVHLGGHYLSDDSSFFGLIVGNLK